MAAAALIPLVAMIPSLVKSVAEVLLIIRTPELTEEERAARLDALADRLDVQVKEVEAMELPERQPDE